MNASDHSERAVRLAKIARLRAQGIHPYPEKFDKRESVDASLRSPLGTSLKTAGRFMSRREMGGIIFGHVQDDTGQIQLVFKEDALDPVGAQDFASLRDLVDVGDFLGIEGERYETQRGEPSILVKQWTLLGKAIRPLPEKFHGLKDQETKYRQRYLDLVTNRDTFDRFLLRSQFIKLLREFYWQEGFIEIESSTLGNTASGALAKPFVTHHDALNQDFYLRIAIETPQKEAIVGGFEKTFEIGKVFRNEGMDPSHLQEFTAAEHYAAYWNYEDNIRFTETMLQCLLTNLFGGMKVNIPNQDGNLIETDFTPPYPVVTLRELLINDAGIDITKEDTTGKLRAAIQVKGIAVEDLDKLEYGSLVDVLYKKVSRKKIVNPTFLTGHPVELSPLARKNDADPRIVDRFQLVVAGWEIVNAYSELVDPMDQKRRFDEQAAAQEKGDSEAHGKDDAYIKAMEYGMPPISGWGMGIDRLIALLTQQDNLRDVILFPLMRPEGEETTPRVPLLVREGGETISSGRDGGVLSSVSTTESTKRLIAILNEKIEPGRLMNALAHMTAGLIGGRDLSEEANFQTYVDKDRTVDSKISDYNFIVLRARNSDALRKVLHEARTEGIQTNFFTSTMVVGGTGPQMEATANTPEAELDYWGVCLFGETERLKPLTKKFSLFT